MYNVNFTIYPHRHKTSVKTGKTPIYLRLFGDGDKMETRLDRLFDLSPGDLFLWDEFTQRLKVKDSEVNDYLNLVASRFKKLKMECLETGKTRSLGEIRDVVLKREEQKTEPTVIEYAKKFLEEDVENNPAKKLGTKINYRNAIGQLSSFLVYKKKEYIKIPEFDFSLADGFKKYLESPDTGFTNRRQNQPVSAATKIKNIKPIFARAISEGLILNSPFKRLKLKFDSPKAFYLNINQLTAIYHLDTGSNDALEYAKDLFLFMCFTGLSYTDAVHLSKKSNSIHAGNRIYFDTSRIKSSVEVRQVFNRYAQQILEKYDGAGFTNLPDRIFPDETGESVNRKLKLIAALAGIPDDISTKTGRNTCSELFFYAGLEEELLINCFMGWSNNKNIRKRYLGLGYDKLLKFTLVLEGFLDKTLQIKN